MPVERTWQGMPEEKFPIHTCPYRIIYGDTDKAGVVYHANYLRLFEIGRTEYLRTFTDFSYAQLEQKGIVMPITELSIRYKAPAHYDDLLIIATTIGDLQRFSIRFNYEIYRAEGQRLLLRGWTKHAVTGAEGRLCPVPEQVAAALQQLKKSY